MSAKKVSAATQAWSLFDRITREALLKELPVWRKTEDGTLEFVPDYETLKMLLRVPPFVDAGTRSGLPALEIDVWVANELRRAGFSSDAVWPRDSVPRILPGSIAKLLQGMTKRDSAHLRQLLATGNTFKGTVGASAKLLGKNYFKQVDVVMSDWDTGPEILISTKRMDDSYGRNAPNRIEESYGDAKNLRSRHPLAALGFVFALRADAYTEAPHVADWITDLLIKLGREEDAYDSVALIVPQYEGVSQVPERDDTEAQYDSLIEAELLPEVEESPVPVDDIKAEELFEALLNEPEVSLLLDKVPSVLSPGHFLAEMIKHVFDNCPITRHEEARLLMRQAQLSE